MKDVARLAAVSVSTVSAVVNGGVPVSPVLRKLVLDALDALGFYPDAIAPGLRTGRTNTIGVVIPDITNPFLPEMIRGIS